MTEKKSVDKCSIEWKKFKKGILKMHPSPNKLLYKDITTGKVVKYIYHHSWAREGWERSNLVKADYDIIKKADKKWQQKKRK